MKDYDLTQDIYTHVEVDKMLRKSRTVKYEYVIRNQYNKTIGNLTNAEGSISFDSTKEVMRTCSIKARKSELLDINSVDERIVPYFCILAPNGHWLKYPLGVFIINPASEYNNNQTYINVEGYDLGQIALSQKLEETVAYLSGTVYTSAISNRVGALYTSYDVVPNSDLTRPSDIEYEIGKTEISVINDMLNAINYYPLYFDEMGEAHAEPYIFPENRTVQIQYSADGQSIIHDGIGRTSNIFETPNRFVRYTDNSDLPPMKSVVTVDDPLIPTSTARRGRIITDVQSVSDVATQVALDNLTRRAAIAQSQQTEILEFTTVNMPVHGFKNCLQVRCEEAGINNKFIETAWEMDLSIGGSMKHICQKVVDL